MGGNHLGAFYGSAERAIERLPSILSESVPIMGPFEDSVPRGPNRFFSLARTDLPASLMAVVEADPERKSLDVKTFYPFLKDGAPRPLRIKAIRPDEEGVEAVLSCVDQKDISICLFDPLYASHKDALREGHRFTFSMAALAYRLEPLSEKIVVHSA